MSLSLSRISPAEVLGGSHSHSCRCGCGVCTVGRAVAEKKRMQIIAVRRIQRNCRRYVLRRERAFPLALFHKLFFLAARRIQTLVRRLLAVKRAQVQLVGGPDRTEPNGVE